mgnify:CR=1 FL=1
MSDNPDSNVCVKSDTAEAKRLHDHRKERSNWKHWGPYLSERAWGTVREDYSEGGDAWSYFPFEHARSRTYRWNEDGLAGVCDRNQYLCLSLALWNGKDEILKERLFGLSGPQGNHGEDVKELYFYLDSTPTHSYMKMLYKYPQAAFPYKKLREENERRGYDEDEYELLDTGVFDDERYFDVFVEYAKTDQNDIFMVISVTNNGPESAPLHVLPQVWFRNTWSWGYDCGPMGDVEGNPKLEQAGEASLRLEHPTLGTYHLHTSPDEDGANPEFLFTENETNNKHLFGSENASPYVKDAFHHYLVEGETEAVNPEKKGTKAAVLFEITLEPGETKQLRLRLCEAEQAEPFASFSETLETRQTEANAFYDAVQSSDLSDELRRIQRQALAGMLWNKQLYYLDIEQWLEGDPAQPPPPEARKHGRNSNWKHLHNFDLISMPDTWEYPWYAVWDTAFHCIPLALVDAEFAKRQLELITREWYMHPNGQLPAYEWNFGDVNPPVHAWAAMRVYQIDAKENGVADRDFLEGIFHKLLLNFTWWVNRKDAEGRNVFQGGFLGLDNISVFDRSAELPTGGHLSQSDGTAWMGFFSLSMLRIALELALDNPVYEDIATKFFEHFLTIAAAINDRDGQDNGLWDTKDGIYYDELDLPDGERVVLRVRSLVSLMPLIAVYTLDSEQLEKLPTFARRMDWFLHNRPDLAGQMADMHEHGAKERLIMSFLTKEKLESVLGYLLDEAEFLSPHGVRSLSKYHKENPYVFKVEGTEAFTVRYQPAEARSGLFGGNSNWRGPVWFPITYLIIEALQRYHHFYGDEFKVECPTGSGNYATLDEVATDLSRRLIQLFTFDETGTRPTYEHELFQTDAWRDYTLFYEYFNGDTGAGLGASHQTGWTGLVAKLIQQSGQKM